MRVGLRRSPEARRFAEAAAPNPETAWREAEWLAVDLELTGLDHADEIISIGAVPIRAGALILGESLYTLARPHRPSNHAAILVHKLRPADLSDAPALDDAIGLLLASLAGRVPVFHTSMVERSFLGREFRRRRVRLPADVDTEELGRLWLQERDGIAPRRMSLGHLTSVLNLPAETPHHALGDALSTAKAFISLASHLDSVAPQTVGSLRRAPNLIRTAAGSARAPTA